ncbi:MAG: type II toxin-antitoxin system VapC family toxin [Brevundimonas sp.]|nr:MAG: type II toxin-antitoxin system VapC family toxin [Brevundimonas sp.]
MILLDTHLALWSMMGHSKLSRRAIHEIEASDAVFFSAISLVEITIKHARGNASPDPIPVNAQQAAEEFRRAGFQELDFTSSHAEMMDRLPPIHRDPFDRMLVAQALSEPMRFLTHDAALAAYSQLVEVV